MTHFTCPHCGRRTSTDRTDVEWVDVGSGQDSLFPSLPPGKERHVDQRLCCPECYDEAAPWDPDLPHPYDVACHDRRLARCQEEHDAKHRR